MPNIFQHKRSVTTNIPSALAFGEIAYSQSSQTVYCGRNNGVPEAIGGLGTFATLASPIFTGTPQVPTASTGNSSAQIASTSFVQTAINALLQNKDIKESCRAASSTNISIAAPGATIDGVAMVPGDRLFVYAQTTQTENGLYVWNGPTTPLTRTSDADTSAKVTPGLIVTVEEGTLNADTAYFLTTNAPITLGSTALVFVAFPGAGGLIAGVGLTRTLSTFNVSIDNATIYANGSNQLAIKSSAIANQIILSQGSGSATYGALPLGNTSAVAGILGIANGGLNRSTAITGLILGSGGSYIAAVDGTDYLSPNTTIDGGTF